MSKLVIFLTETRKNFKTVDNYEWSDFKESLEIEK